LSANGGGNVCKCQIILNSRSEIVSGHFSENSFKYHITNGSYCLDRQCIEFTKEYFNYNYKYKVYGQIERNLDNENLQFVGYWKLLNGSRGGNVRMHHVSSSGVDDERIQSGEYAFFGHCDYLPNADNNLLFDAANGQRIKCLLRLQQRDFGINGAVTLLEQGSDGFMTSNGTVFAIDALESEWDQYGGIHCVLQNGYSMDGFFNGNDFMGVWKDDRLKRFGHFQYEIIRPIARQEEEQKEIGTDMLTRARSLDDSD